MTHLKKLFLVAVAAALPCASVHAASLSLVFDTPSVTAVAGQTIVFTGTVTNLEDFVVDLNTCAVNLPGISNYNCDIFFDPILGAPLTLNPNSTAGDSAHFSLMTVIIDDPYTGPYGVPFAGAYTITGGIEFPEGTSPDTVLVEQTFDVTVAPEPGTFALLGLAIPAAFFFKRRRS
jgi:hypothetical protein